MVLKILQDQAPLPQAGCITFEQMNIITNLNKLWMEYAFWMRALINSTLIDSEREGFIADKLFNGVMLDFFNLFEFYYGAQLAQTFMNLFTNFATGAWGLLRALKNNNEAEINAQTVQLNQRANELADFFAQINVYYSADQWRYLFYQAIRLIIDEALSIINKDFDKEIEISDSMANLAMLMGDYTARGLLAGLYQPAPAADHIPR
jgi:hypothetical protein